MSIFVYPLPSKVTWELVVWDLADDDMQNLNIGLYLNQDFLIMCVSAL